MTGEHSDLIYDVGLFDGGDTAYYLFRGYRVVAIDANPLMIERAGLRFSKEVLSKQLTLLNVGISKAPGSATFWVSDVPEWSSFDKTIASRNDTAHTPVSVATVPFSQLLAEHGVPHYLKIDIEGNDRLCVEALSGPGIPKYISVESECVGDSVALSDEQSVAMLELLRDVGYRRFKLVSQRGWTAERASAAEHFSMRLVNSAAHGRLRVGGLSRIAEKFTDPARIAKIGFPFSEGSSGPWGEDIPGGWVTFEKAKSMYLRTRHSFFSYDRKLYSFWYDWHATY
jgi:FkbM family methyltransferase